MYRPVAGRRDGRGLLGMAVAQLCRYAQRSVECIEWDKIYIVCVELTGIQLAVAGEIYAVLLRAYTADVQRFGQRQPETAPLTDCIADNTSMRADGAAVGRDKIPARVW